MCHQVLSKQIKSVVNRALLLSSIIYYIIIYYYDYKYNFIHNTINIFNSNINMHKTVAKRVLDWGCLACWILSSSDVTAFIKYESEILWEHCNTDIYDIIIG